MLLKLWFYGYAIGVFTSRKIQTATYENIPFRWLCGGLHPDFRTLSDFRKNHLHVLPGLFKQIIEIAMTLGYVTLGHVSIDGTKIKANASKHKAMSRQRMKQEIERLEADIHQAMNEAEQADTKDEMSLSQAPPMTEVTVSDRQIRLAKIKAALKELEERKPEAESKTAEKDQINFTDSASRIMDTKTPGVIQGYNPQIAVDEDHHFIVGIRMSNSSNDQKQFDGVLQYIEEMTGQSPETTSVDAGYFSAENIQAAKAHHTDAYIAANREGKAIYLKRKAIVEPAFGEMKEVQGFRQFHLRGEEKVSGEFLLLAQSYNLRKLHSAKYHKKATIEKRERSAKKRKKAA